MAAVSSSTAAALWCGVVWIAVRQYQHALTITWIGVDTQPLRGAGRAVLNGTDVYTVHNFVYPPTAAVASIPLAWVDSGVLGRAAVVAQEVVIAGLAAAVVLAFVPPGRVAIQRKERYNRYGERPGLNPG